MMSTPLLPEDPPKIGDFWLDARLLSAPAGVTYLAHGDGVDVLLILLSAGAAEDAAARDRLAGIVNELDIDTVVARGGHGQDEGRLGGKFRSEEDDPVEPDDQELAPWVAIANDHSPAAAAEAQRILSEVALATLPPKGTPSGPDYRLHWVDDTRPGMARLWPLPWPGKHERAGWVSILVSWLIMLLIAALAVLIAILIFQNNNAGSPPPPVPTSGGSPNSGSGSPESPQSASGSPSGSPTESGSASGSPSGSPSGSGTPSESPGDIPSHTKTPTFISPTGGTASGGGSSESPNRRLIIRWP
ncbi:hypothetical protein [Propionicicella superfundia]|uniref:hypothetical protein n=1 Tax=Propionicicella superfundia TaxID=348582 RepID=UPI0009FE7DAF|nr:hypothetical protein [Propionicicella superfundia]